MIRLVSVSLLLLAVAVQELPLQPLRSTAAVPHDADDPAIWVSQDASQALILATDKNEIDGGLYVFDLSGALKHSIAPLDRPNNVDVEYGMRVGDRVTDIAVVTERKKNRLRVFGIAADGSSIRDLAPGGVAVFEGEQGEAAEPMGIALYKRPRDGAVFAIVAPKTGGATDYLWQYELRDSNGSITGRLVRRFGAFSRRGPTPVETGEIEAVVADDALGYVYYADESFGIRKWHADPDHPGAARELAVLGTSGYHGDREGLALYSRPDGTGFLVSSDQLPGATRLMIYPRSGPRGQPHDQTLIRAISTNADSTDGLDVTSIRLPGFHEGLLVMMNSTSRNFLFYPWGSVMARLN